MSTCTMKVNAAQEPWKRRQCVHSEWLQQHWWTHERPLPPHPAIEMDNDVRNQNWTQQGFFAELKCSFITPQWSNTYLKEPCS